MPEPAQLSHIMMTEDGNGILSPASVTEDKLAPNAVGARQLKKKAVQAWHIDAGAILNWHIRNDSVVAYEKITKRTVTFPLLPQCPPGHVLGRMDEELTGDIRFIPFTEVITSASQARNIGFDDTPTGFGSGDVQDAIEKLFALTTGAATVPVITNNGDGTYDHDDGTGLVVVIDTRDGVSTAPTNTLSVGPDQRPFLAPFVGATSLTAGVAGAVPAPAAAQQDYILYGNGWGPPLRARFVYKTVADFAGPAAGLYTLTITQAEHALGSSITVHVWDSSSVPGTYIHLTPHYLAVNGSGDITIQVPEVPDGRANFRVAVIPVV